MNDTTRLEIRPEAERFVSAVRSHFADLGEEEREELLGGLEADVSELVAEQGSEALGEPAAYADELRAAAGLAPSRRRLRIPHHSPGQWIDSVRARFDLFVAHPRVAPVWVVVRQLAPAWWLLRAWVVAVLICRALPGWDRWGLDWMPGVASFVAVPVFAACLAVSVLVGLGRLRPGSAPNGSRGVGARVVLAVLNTAAICLVPVATATLGDAIGAQWQEGYNQAYRDAQFDLRRGGQGGVVNDGRAVCNIAAYDAQGQPLSAVQLYDQDGNPLDMTCTRRETRRVPWRLGDVARWNVYPIGLRTTPARTEDQRADLTGATFPVPDRASVPAVTNPLVAPEPEPGTEPENEADGERGNKADGKTGDQKDDKAGNKAKRSDRARTGAGR